MNQLDELRDTISDIVALAARVILLAPRERQEVLCAHALHELGETIGTILGHEAVTH